MNTHVQPTTMASQAYLDIAEHSSQDELETMLLRGETPDPEALAGWEYRGTNIGFWTKRSPILKFIKGFYKDATGQVFGYNEPVVQNGRQSPWIAKPSDDDPKRFGFYKVVHVDPTGRDNLYLHALLLDYGQGDNPFYDASKRLRDYIVRVNPGSDDLLLGKAYLKLNRFRLPTLSFFLLERHKPSDWVR